MRYYCNICKKDITPGEFSYSKDKFGRPLCREHQELERRKQGSPIQIEKPAVERMVLEPAEPITEGLIDSEEKNNENAPKSRWRSLGKGILKGLKGIVRSSKKRSQIRKWKTSILRRMTMHQLEQLCFEKGISTTKKVLVEDDQSDEIFREEVKCSQGGLVARLKDKLPLDAIVSFAERSHINIRDILVEKARTEAQWEERDLIEKIDKKGSNKLLEIEKAIIEFPPMRRYNEELYYQDTLASFLRARFPDTRIEVTRGSTRPDIVVKGVAIEIKGPTNDGDLQTIADKCLRYKQYFPKGMICVLFNVNVTQHRYEDWVQGMKKTHPDVKIIKKISL
jgi:hypothetical protein